MLAGAGLPAALGEHVDRELERATALSTEGLARRSFGERLLDRLAAQLLRVL